VTFTPTLGEVVTGTLEITDDAADSPQQVVLTGSGIAPAVALSTASLTFTDQVVGTTSGAQTITLSNTGSAPLNITSIVVSGDFAETHTCGGSVAAGTNCQINVTFAPGARGIRVGTLTITSNALDSPHADNLTGTGIAPVVSLSSLSLAFPGQLVTTTSEAQELTLSNIGDAPLSISSIATSGEFTQNDNCPFSPQLLSPGTNCIVSVTFAPSASGDRTGTLTVTDDAVGSPRTVSLAGIGTDFTLHVSSGSSTSETVSPGQTASFVLSLAPSDFSGNVSLTCTENITAATCSVTPASVTLDGANPVEIKVRVTTTARSVIVPHVGVHRAALEELKQNHRPEALRYMLLVLGALVILEGRQRRPKGLHFPSIKRTAAWGLGAAMLAVLLCASCGGGGGIGEGTRPSPQTGTPSGTYTVTVTATSSGLSHSADLTVQVN
jgi:hypothetical protein